MTQCPRCGTKDPMVVSREPKQRGVEISYKCAKCAYIWKQPAIN